MTDPTIELDLSTGWLWWKNQRCIRIDEVHLREALEDLLQTAAPNAVTIHEREAE